MIELWSFEATATVQLLISDPVHLVVVDWVCAPGMVLQRWHLYIHYIYMYIYIIKETIIPTHFWRRRMFMFYIYSSIWRDATLASLYTHYTCKYLYIYIYTKGNNHPNALLEAADVYISHSFKYIYIYEEIQFCTFYVYIYIYFYFLNIQWRLLCNTIIYTYTIKKKTYIYIYRYLKKK